MSDKEVASRGDSVRPIFNHQAGAFPLGNVCRRIVRDREADRADLAWLSGLVMNSSARSADARM